MVCGSAPPVTEEIYKLYAESFRGKVHLQIPEDAQALITAALVRHGAPPADAKQWRVIYHEHLCL